MQVKYIGASDEQINWGRNTNPRGLLVVGDVYDVESEEVHSWHTKIRLVGIDGEFNSVCFEEDKDAPKKMGT